jgi:hypothetical protein
MPVRKCPECGVNKTMPVAENADTSALVPARFYRLQLRRATQEAKKVAYT